MTKTITVILFIVGIVSIGIAYIFSFAADFYRAVTQKWVLPKERPENAPVDSKVVLPKSLENGTEGSRGTWQSGVPRSRFLGASFIRSGAPVKLPFAAGSVQSLSSAAPPPASKRTD